MWINKILSWIFFANILQPKISAQSLATKFLFVAVLGLAFNWNTFGKLDYPMLSDTHASCSLEMALNWKMCSKFSNLTVPNNKDISIQTMMQNNKEILDQPLSSLPIKLKGSIEAYCNQPLVSFTNNENSLMYLEAAILELSPNLTLNQLGAWLSSFRMAINLVFATALLRIGLSPLFALASFVAVQHIISRMDITDLYSLYPNILPLCLGFAIVTVLVIKAYPTKKLWIVFLASLVLGLFAGFVGNMRSSYSLVCVSGLVLLLFILNKTPPAEAVIFKEDGEKKPKGNLRIGKKYLAFGAIALGYFVGLYTFDATLIGAIRKENSGHSVQNRAYHVVAHPLVLGLATPENDFAKQQGIRWNDSIGPILAQQIDPNVKYMDENYEKALFAYYAKLWIDYPEEMVGLYLKKWQSAAQGISFGFKPINYILPKLDGIILTVLLAELFIGSYLLLRQTSAVTKMLIMFPLLVALLSLGESAMIMSAYLPIYYAPIRFGVDFGCLLIMQIIANRLIMLSGKLTNPLSHR